MMHRHRPALSNAGALSADDWIVHADSDEFHRYPGGNLPAFLAAVSAHGRVQSPPDPTDDDSETATTQKPSPFGDADERTRADERRSAYDMYDPISSVSDATDAALSYVGVPIGVPIGSFRSANASVSQSHDTYGAMATGAARAAGHRRRPLAADHDGHEEEEDASDTDDGHARMRRHRARLHARERERSRRLRAGSKRASAGGPYPPSHPSELSSSERVDGSAAATAPASALSLSSALSPPSSTSSSGIAAGQKGAKGAKGRPKGSKGSKGSSKGAKGMGANVVVGVLRDRLAPCVIAPS